MSKENIEAVVGTELTQEIEGAVEKTVEAADAVREAASGKPKVADPPPEKEDDPPPADDPTPPPTDAPEISDDLVERAVRAGIPMKDAREIKSAGVLERMCDRLEAKAADGAKAGEQKKTDEAKGDDDPLAGIPDLDPTDYDEKIVAGFKAMKTIIQKQQEVIARLGDGSARKAETIDDRLQGLGKAFAEAAPAGSEKRADLERKFKVLKAGYEAAGEKVDEATVFGEAVQIVLRDVEDSEQNALKAAKLEKRKNLHLNRPSGSSIKPAGDVLADVAAEVDARFNKK